MDDDDDDEEEEEEEEDDDDDEDEVEEDSNDVERPERRAECGGLSVGMVVVLLLPCVHSALARMLQRLRAIEPVADVLLVRPAFALLLPAVPSPATPSAFSGS